MSVITFVVGLAIGLLQLYLAQWHFETEQRARMDEVRNSLTEIKENIAALRELNSQRSFEIQNKLIQQFAARDQEPPHANQITTDDIHQLVEMELKKAATSDTPASKPSWLQ